MGPHDTRLHIAVGDRIGPNTVIEVEATATNGHHRRCRIQCDDPTHPPRWYSISLLVRRPPKGCRRCTGKFGGAVPRVRTTHIMPAKAQRRTAASFADLPIKVQILRLRARGMTDEAIGKELDMRVVDVQAFARS